MTMTAALKSGSQVAMSGSVAQAREFSMWVAAALAVLASLVLAAHSWVGGRPAQSESGDARPAVPAASAPESVAPQHASVRSRADDAHVAALVDAASRKYRVSTDAMRVVVDTAYTEARRNRLDPLLILAVMAIESRFNPIAESNYGATGLMQVIPRFHAEKFSAKAGESVLDPQINIRVGTRALKEYVVRGGNETAGLQLYNGAASDPRNAYAEKVLAERARLREVVRKSRAVGVRQSA
jgi:soluble lytic murein transglycosylase-like protein